MSPSKRKSNKPASDSVPPTPPDGEFDADLLPRRLYETDRYPPGGRINSYSTPSYLLDLVESLEGTPEFNYLKASCFGALFDLPVRKSSMSGKLVHQLLCRALKTDKKYELWFLFAGQPFRFSLREFGLITGLPCGPYPPLSELEKLGETAESDDAYWYTLISKDEIVSIKDIVGWLKVDRRKPIEDRMPGWRRLRLALIVIAEGILICSSQPVRPSKVVVEMVKDLEAFEKYPWGRESFQLTLRMVTVSQKCPTLADLIFKLNQSHTATHGFTLALQLMIFKAIPALEKYLPDSDDEKTFTDRSIIHLTQLKTYHNSNIMEIENLPNLKIDPYLQSEEILYDNVNTWPVEVEDPSVVYMERLISSGFCFSRDIWQGGVATWPRIVCSSKSRLESRPKPASKWVKPSKISLHARSSTVVPVKGKGKVGENTSFHSDLGGEAPFESVSGEVKAYVDTKLGEHTAVIQNLFSVERSLLKDELFDEIIRELRHGGKFPIPMKSTPTPTMLDKDTGIGNEDGIPAEQENNLMDKTSNQVDKVTDPNRKDSVDNFESMDNSENVDKDPASMDKDPEQMDKDCDPMGPWPESAEKEAEHIGNSSEMGGCRWPEYPGVSDVVKSVETHSVIDLSATEKVVEQVGNINVPHGSLDDSTLARDGSEEKLNEGDDGTATLPLEEVILPLPASSVSTALAEPIGSAPVPMVEEQTMPPSKEHIATDGFDPIAKDGPANFENKLIPNVPSGDDTEEGHKSDTGDTQADEPMSTGSDPIATDGGLPQNLKKKSTPDETEEDNDSDTNDSATASGESHNSGCKRVSRPEDVDGEEDILSPLPAKRTRRAPRRFVDTQPRKKSEPAASVKTKGSPFQKINPQTRKKFLSKLSAFRGREYLVDGRIVDKKFFTTLHTPQMPVDTPHVEGLLSLIWRQQGDILIQKKVGILDTWFTHVLSSDSSRFKKGRKGKELPWNSMLKNYVRGIVPGRQNRLAWYEDVDTVYAPMNWGKDHWVALAIDIKSGNILVLDPYICTTDDKKMQKMMKPITDMLPLLIRDLLSAQHPKLSLPSSFHTSRLADVSQNDRTGDFGPMAVKFVELHALGFELDGISDSMVDNLRMKFAVEMYEEFVQSLSD